MFLLNGTPLSPDRAFTTEDGTQFPANWLRLATVEEREAVGITEEPDPIPVDQRFYWDTGIPKDHAQLVEQWVSQVKQTAATLLVNTDWLITRSSDPSSQKPVPQWALDERSEIRTKSDEKEAAIEATTSTDELAAYVTGPEFGVWETPELLPTEEVEP
jgi:hypothetical protein